MQASQMNTFGPEINLLTSLGGRSQNVQTASRFLGRHHEPPATSTICCTLWWLK
jgi:hypothetical protein